MNLDLPEMCYSVSEMTKEVILIKRGKMGFEPVPSLWKDMTIAQAEFYANSQNNMLGILPEERMAMEVGAILGWDLLGADPQTYLDKAVLLSERKIKAHIKDVSLSIFYPVVGDLYEYHLLGEKRCFFSWEDLPKELFDRKFVTINGKHLLPVSVKYSRNGSITLFSVGREKTKEVGTQRKERRTMSNREPVRINGVVAYPNSDGDRLIRFIDSSYHDLFRIPDGGNVVLLTMEGERMILPCKYIDDYHACIGDSTLHICQFAEIMEKKGAVYFPEHPKEKDILDTYEIYQIKNMETTSYSFCSYEKTGKQFKRADYECKYRGVLSPEVDKEELFIKHNRDSRPFGDRMHSLSASDVIVVKRNGEKKAFYVDNFGFKEVPKFLKKSIKKKVKGEER